MKIWNIIPEYLHNETHELIGKIINDTRLQFIETKRITKHGKVVDVFFSATVIVDPENGKKSVAITERDITEQKIAEEQILQLNRDLKLNVIQLEKTNKEIESFSYSISHDLRAPLRALSGYTKMLEEDYSESFDDNAKNIMDTIHKSIAKMNDLIGDLLEFSRMEKKQIKKTKVNMPELVNSVIEEIKTSTSCHADFAIDSLTHAYADNALIHQVWFNLISNAVKYSSKKSNPHIEIGSWPEPNELVFYVKDNGTGFDMNYAYKLFGVFQRLHKASEFEGTGIGLAIINRVITKHGGRVWAEAKVDEGATFYFTLPLADDVTGNVKP